MDVLEELRTEFDKADEVDYARLAEQLGPGALPALEELVGGENTRLAAHAVYLAGLLGGSKSVEVIFAAAHSAQAIVRVAVAFTLPRLPAAPAARLAMRLLADEDAGVRARAVRFAAPSGDPLLVRRVREIARTDPEHWVRKLARDLLNGLNGGGPPG